jgi:membrane-associated phospholipid phosphatase
VKKDGFGLKAASKLENILFPSVSLIAASLIVIAYYWAKGSMYTMNHVISFISSLAAYAILRRIVDKRENSETKRYTIPGIGALAVFMTVALLLPMERIFLLGWFSGLVLVLIGHLLRDHWKISGHTMMLSSIATVLSLTDSVFLPSLVMIPIIAWSRVRLERHTPAQVVAGAAAGIIVPLILIRFL